MTAAYAVCSSPRPATRRLQVREYAKMQSSLIEGVIHHRVRLCPHTCPSTFRQHIPSPHLAHISAISYVPLTPSRPLVYDLSSFSAFLIHEKRRKLLPRKTVYNFSCKHYPTSLFFLSLLLFFPAPRISWNGKTVYNYLATKDVMRCTAHVTDVFSIFNDVLTSYVSFSVN